MPVDEPVLNQLYWLRVSQQPQWHALHGKNYPMIFSDQELVHGVRRRKWSVGGGGGMGEVCGEALPISDSMPMGVWK